MCEINIPDGRDRRPELRQEDDHLASHPSRSHQCDQASTGSSGLASPIYRQIIEKSSENIKLIANLDGANTGECPKVPVADPRVLGLDFLE